MSNPIYIDFSSPQENFNIESKNNPEYDLIKVENVPSAEYGLQILNQAWMKNIISSRQNGFAICFSIDENIDKNFNEKPNFLDFPNITSILIAFQSKIGDHESKTYWKIRKNEYFYSLFIDNDIEEVVTSFVHEFISYEIKNRRTGFMKSCRYRRNIRIYEIGKNSKNLLIIAALWNRPNIVQKLLKFAFDVDYEDSQNNNAIDYAWINYISTEIDQNKHQSTEILVALLKSNSRIPQGFEFDKAPHEVQEFIVMCEHLHEIVKNNDFISLKKKLNEYSNLVNFYNRDNKSILAFALESKRFKIIDILNRGLCTGFHENLDDVYKHLSDNLREKIGLKHQKNSIDFSDSHLLILKTKTRICNNDQFSSDRWEFINSAYEKLNANDYCSKILKVVCKYKNFKIFFDFKHETTYYMDPLSSINMDGIAYMSGVIIIGAKYLTIESFSNEVIGVIAHELCHLAMYITYMNHFNPFPTGESKEKSRYQEYVMVECNKNKEKEQIIQQVYDNYDEKSHCLEMIVRYPQILMHYYGKKDKIEKFCETFDELYRYSKKVVEQEFDAAMPVLIKLADENINIKFDQLTNPMKANILNTEIEFQGTSTSFYELIGDDEEILKLLSSDQLRLMLTTLFVLEIGEICETNIKYDIIERSFKEQKEIKPYKKPSIFRMPEIFRSNTEEDNGETITLMEVKDELKFNKTFILADHAGTGKTTIFKFLARQLKEDNKNYWVSYINLKNCDKVFDKYQKKAGRLNENDVQNIMLEIIKPASDIEKKILLKLYLKCKVILLFDGFDEVCPKYFDLVMDIFKVFHLNGRCEKWISTRPNYAENLSNFFKISIHKFIPCTKEQNEQFIKTILKNNQIACEKKQNQTYDEVVKFTKEIENSADVRNPLMVQIITELYISKKIVLDINSRYGIYQLMVNKQKEIVGDKIPFSDRDVDSELNVWDIHRILALISVFTYGVGVSFNKLPIVQIWLRERKKWTSDMIQRYGFVVVNLNEPDLSSNLIDFTHRSYAEFFAAQFLINYIFESNYIFSDEESNTIEKFLEACTNFFENVYNFIISYGKNEGRGKLLRPNYINFLDKSIAKYYSVWTMNSDLEKVAITTCIDYQSSKKLWKVNEDKNLLQISFRRSENLYFNYESLPKYAEISFGPNWHEEFNKCREKLITDREIEEFRDEGLEESKWINDKKLLKMLDLLQKNFNYFHLEKNQLSIQSLRYVNSSNRFIFGHSTKIQIEMISRMCNIFDASDFFNDCLIFVDFKYISHETLDFIYKCLEEKLNYNTEGIRKIILKDYKGWRSPLFRAFRSNNPNMLKSSQDFFLKYSTSWKEIFDCLLDNTKTDILYPIDSIFYNEYKSLILEAYGSNLSKLRKRLENYHHIKKNEGIFSTLKSYAFSDAFILENNRDNLVDFLAYLFPKDQEKLDEMVKLFNNTRIYLS